jgi:TolA-binding protein
MRRLGKYQIALAIGALILSDPSYANSSPPSAERIMAVAAIKRPLTGDAFEDGHSYGYSLWEAKFYPEARFVLEETLVKFPNHKRASYARYLLGRAWLDDKKPATAVKVFYENYKADPRGDRAPDSLLFLGSALTDLGKAAEACEAFGELQRQFPDEASGRLSVPLSVSLSAARCIPQRIVPEPVDQAARLSDAQAKCAELGFTPGTEKFGNCVLKVSR